MYGQFKSHLKIDGLKKYISSTVKSMMDPGIRKAFMGMDTIKDIKRFGSYFCYGLYINKKCRHAK
jgi:hypothetical protein